MMENRNYFTFSREKGSPPEGVITFSVGSVVCIGNFKNALEGAILASLGTQESEWSKQERCLEGGTVLRTNADMFLPVVPGLWSAARIFDDDNLMFGSLIWNVEKVGGIEDACSYANGSKGYADRQITRYTWDNLRNPKDHDLWPQNARVDDLIDDRLSGRVFNGNTVFFCNPDVFLEQVVPVIRSMYRILRRLRSRIKKHVNDIKIPPSFQLYHGISSIAHSEGVVCHWSYSELPDAAIFFEKDVLNPRAIAIVTQTRKYSEEVYLENYPINAPRWVLDSITCGMSQEALQKILKR